MCARAVVARSPGRVSLGGAWPVLCGGALGEHRGGSEWIRDAALAYGRAVSEQYGVRDGYGCASAKRTKKKAPPGQTLFSNFLFSGPVSWISNFFSGLLVFFFEFCQIFILFSILVGINVFIRIHRANHPMIPPRICLI